MSKSLIDAGFSIKESCACMDLPRSAYYRQGAPVVRRERIHAPDEALIVEKIKSIKLEHPFWGYRRVHAWLKNRDKIVVNIKRIRRMMKEHNLMASETVHRAKRTPQRSKPKATRPGQIWGIDMTKFMVPSVGWVYLVLVLDWYTKKVVGWDISLRSRTREWKAALDMAINREFPDGVRGKGMKLVSDNGCQPTSKAFMNDMAVLGVEQIFTSYNNPKGNADTERMMRTVKEEVIWLNEFESVMESADVIGRWFEDDYNRLYVHSALGYRSPEEFKEEYYSSRLKLAA